MTEISPRRYLRKILNDLSEKHGLPFKEVRFKNQKTLWGSCSGRNNINLNLNLAKLPRELAEYVILHELVHTVHKNHSKSFWSHLTKLCPNAMELNKKVRKIKL